MNFKEWFNKVSINNKDIYYRLVIVFCLFFIAPAIGLIYFSYKYSIFSDAFFAPFFVVYLVLFFLGFRLLRKMFDNIRNISTTFTKTAEEKTKNPLTVVTDELSNIVQSFRALEEELKSKVVHLEKKTSEVETLRELADLSYMTLNADYLLFIALERSLKLVNADIGSVMILSRPSKDTFVIKASIGLADYAKKGTITAFDDSIAKYTIINKAPLLVEDIETDARFGRPSRGQYSTKSFICMPLKTSNDTIGVITLSRRRSGLVFTQTDVDLLTPLLSNTSYIYDNINLFQEIKELSRSITSLQTISKAVNSSLKGQELPQLVFEQMRKNFSFDVIVFLTMNPDNPQKLSITDFKGYIPTNLNRGRNITFEGSILELAIKEQRDMFIPNVSELTAYIDKKLFGQPDVHTALIMPLKVEGRVQSLIVMLNLLETDWNRLRDIIDVMGDHLAMAMEKDRLNAALTKQDRELNSVRLIGGPLTVSTFDIEKISHALEMLQSVIPVEAGQLPPPENKEHMMDSLKKWDREFEEPRPAVSAPKTSKFDIENIFTQTMEMIQAVIPVEAGYLMLPEKDELIFAAAFHFDMQKLKTFNLQIREGVTGNVFERGVPEIVNNAQQHPQFSPVVDRETGFTTQTILCVPLISHGQVIGVLELLNKKTGDFTEADEKILQSVAVTISMTLENDRLAREAAAKAAKQPLHP